jgi:hypothetical protein
MLFIPRIAPVTGSHSLRSARLIVDHLERGLVLLNLGLALHPVSRWHGFYEGRSQVNKQD